MALRLHRTRTGAAAELDGQWYGLDAWGWNDLFARQDLVDWLPEEARTARQLEEYPPGALGLGSSALDPSLQTVRFGVNFKF